MYYQKKFSPVYFAISSSIYITPKYLKTKMSPTGQARPYLYDHGDKRKAKQQASQPQNVPPHLRHKTKMSYSSVSKNYACLCMLQNLIKFPLYPFLS